AEVGTWQRDFDTGTHDWDERSKELFGLPPSAVITRDTIIQGVHPDDRARVKELEARALDPAGTGEFALEHRTIGIHDGIERWLYARGRAFFRDGRPVRFV